MKNKITKIFATIFLYLIVFNANSSEQFNFDVTEIQILENGNKFIGTNRGTISSLDGVTINADNFEYDKKLNLLMTSGNVEINDKKNNYLIYSDKIIYNKKEEIFFTENNSKAISLNDNTLISADDFEFNRSKNILTAKKNVFIENKEKNYTINSEFISYFRNEEKILTKGKTSALVHSKYNFKSADVIFLKSSMQLSSRENTTIKDKLNLYNLSNFKYLINEEELRGEKITISSNYNLPNNDKFYFSSAIINLKSNNFVAKDTSIEIHKGIFQNSDNDPRLKGVSSSKSGDITIINKGIFTSCKKNDTCPPWSIEARTIKHNKIKRQIDYKNALLKIYDIPVLYFPKFFHPDPSVKRQSGLLKPVLNKSNVLGSSLAIPYYKVLSYDSDITIAPTIFDNSIKILQNEYRKVAKNFNFITNFGHTRDYKSTLLNKNKNISYLFSKLDLDLNLENFNSSKMYLNLEKVTDDTFLKIFNTNLIGNATSLKPESSTDLTSELKFILNNDNYNLTTGFKSFENLQLLNSDRYQYILPYYEFNKNIFTDFKLGSISFKSNGSNDLNNTNQLKSRIINDVNYSSLDYFSKNGFKNNFNIKFKNLNSLGKNVSTYKTSPQIELSSLFEVNSSLPLKKETKDFLSFITPKASIRINPGDMKNHNTSERTINNNNIFSTNRLGLEDSFEGGKSLTLGIDYKKELLKDMNKYFEIKLATVFRDKKEQFVPNSTTLNKKTSNIFGSISNNFSENFNINYNFALDNNLDEIKYNELNSTIYINNFETNFNYIKEIDEMGDQNFLENNTSYKFDEQNYFTFNTRRNKKLNLTEFYDLVYEYKNDCLIAGIKYKKTYYEDRDLKPTEDLLFTITLFPLTTFEQKLDQ